MKLDPSQIVSFSAETGLGKDVVLRFFTDCLAALPRK